ncbi:hypothetical protein [uncultured Limosilactobacillus sp.]|uniref:hypothetical protein n=1 Tax=uncultured Limosilactobacillus sp. TaxID=2837629 RepID=UPI0025DDB700|nr:hypothetical protein [uncultured Limosilactobacillus sp.]
MTTNAIIKTTKKRQAAEKQKEKLEAQLKTIRKNIRDYQALERQELIDLIGKKLMKDYGIHSVEDFNRWYQQVRNRVPVDHAN